MAPFGLAGTLTGQSFKSSEMTARFLDDWSQFYPLDKTSSLTDSSVVEVVVGGVKMRYPSCYVLVTDLDDNVNSEVINGIAVSAQSERRTEEKRGASPVLINTPPPSPVQINSRVPQQGPYTVSFNFYSEYYS